MPRPRALREFVRTEAARNPYPPFVNDNRTDTFTFSAASPLNPRTLQEAVRALGQLRDTNALPLLRELLADHIEPRTGNLYLSRRQSLSRSGASVRRQRSPPSSKPLPRSRITGITSAGIATIRRFTPAIPRRCMPGSSLRSTQSAQRGLLPSCRNSSAPCPPTRIAACSCRTMITKCSSAGSSAAADAETK